MSKYFLTRCQQQFQAQAEPLTMETLHYLQCMDWPGNIRELSNGIACHVLIGLEESVPAHPSVRHCPPSQVRTEWFR
jgi:transcriptional regulator with PAS, ATPase and Fis domain